MPMDQHALLESVKAYNNKSGENHRWYDLFLSLPHRTPAISLWNPTMAEKSAEVRLETASPEIDIRRELEAIRSISRVPAISVGAVREGRLSIDEHVGGREIRDGNLHNPPDINTIYTLASLSKTFVAAAFSLLVVAGKVKWTDTVGQHIGEFSPKDDPSIANTTFHEILRHSSGIDNPVVTWLGPEGKAIIPREEFIKLLNDTPTKRKGETLWNKLVYSNVAYGLVVLVIERISKMAFADFLQTRILNPLKMHDTAVAVSQVKEQRQKNNVAQAFALLSDGDWVPLDHNWTDERNGPVLGMIGMRSSAKDILIFVSALMDDYASTASEASLSRLEAHSWSQKPFELLEGIASNPLKDTAQSQLDGAYWRIDCKCNGRPAHFFEHLVPWVKTSIPCNKLSCNSFNIFRRQIRGLEEEALGASSASESWAFSFNGVSFCGTTSVKFFPQTRSAVVALSSGLNTADAAEFANLLATQQLLELEPKLDILQMARTEAECRLKSWDNLVKDIQEHRKEVTQDVNLPEYVGEYVGLGITIVISLAKDSKSLELSFNNKRDIVLPLIPYGEDCFSYWPQSRDEWLSGGWLDWDHFEVGLLSFRRNESAPRQVEAASWVWENTGGPAIFDKKRPNSWCVIM